MDPNKLLQELRELAELARHQEIKMVQTMDIGWAIKELDEWLSKGGYLPADWQGRK